MRRRHFVRSALALALLFCASCGSNTPPQQPALTRATPPTPNPKLLYEMREKCEHDATEWFKTWHANDYDPFASVGIFNNEINNHYNEKLNRCYVVLVATGTITKDFTHTLDKHLYDVSENKDLARFFTNSKKSAFECRFGDEKCASLEEWDRHVAPYMEQ